MRFEVVMGVHPGKYGWKESLPDDQAYKIVESAWKHEVMKEYGATGMAVGAFLNMTTVVYITDSMVVSEQAVLIAGNMNQELESCKVSWIDAVKRVVNATRKRLSQDTALLSFDGDEQYYLRD